MKPKKTGKSQYRLFSRHFEDEYKKQRSFEIELNRAQRENEFSMLYQPIIELSSNKTIGIESLVRWKNKKFGIVTPNEFIKFAENTKQIHGIGDWIIEEVLRQCSVWNKDPGLKEKFVSVNISPVQFERKKFVPLLIDSIKEYKLNPKNIVIEIAETAFSQFVKAETLMKMSDEEMLLAIDDFGSGYSSMHRLLELQIDFIKIDGKYFKEAACNKKNQAIIKNTLNIAKSLNIESIAECVETKEQIDFLIENGCNYVQGYYYHKPMKADDIVKLLK